LELETKVCHRCKIEKPRNEFYYTKDSKGRSYLEYICKICKSLYSKERIRKGKTNPTYFKKYALSVSATRRKSRQKCITHYGGKCECCGETIYEFLAIDHINGGGNKHRAEQSRPSIVNWLSVNKFPEGFRILCHNCNSAIGYYGYCPHQYQKSDPYEI
jgi:hypothetical protein